MFVKLKSVELYRLETVPARKVGGPICGLMSPRPLIAQNFVHCQNNNGNYEKSGRM